MIDARKILVASAAITASVLTVFFLWRQPLVASVILLVITALKFSFARVSKEIFWWVLIVVVSGLVEALFVNFAHAWTYAMATPLGVPVHMPILWGVIGTSILSLYESTRTGRRVF